MTTKTAIEWTDSTWNPVRGCTRVSPGCGGPGPHGGCYAEGIAARFSQPGQAYHGLAEMRGGKPRWTGKLALAPAETMTAPLRWRKPRRIFVNSMSDLFHEDMPVEWIDSVFAVMALCPQHTFQVLTKRAARMRAYMERGRERSQTAWLLAARSLLGAEAKGEIPEAWPLPNVWLGVSAEDQRYADERVPDLLATPSAVRFVSAEPLLGPIDFTSHGIQKRMGAHGWSSIWRNNGIGRACLDWIIVGGESGPGARPMHPDWARSIRDQCAAAGVPFFYKQTGEWAPMPDSYADARYSLPLRVWVDGAWTDCGGAEGEWLARVGKRAAGRLLDGIEHNAMPAPRP